MLLDNKILQRGPIGVVLMTKMWLANWLP